MQLGNDALLLKGKGRVVQDHRVDEQHLLHIVGVIGSGYLLGPWPLWHLLRAHWVRHLLCLGHVALCVARARLALRLALRSRRPPVLQAAHAPGHLVGARDGLEEAAGAGVVPGSEQGDEHDHLAPRPLVQ